MASSSLEFVILGLSASSAWGNGHATTYRALIKGLSARGHRVLFLERDVPWYASNRDLPKMPYGRMAFYRSLGELKRRFATQIRRADVVIVGSYVPDGVVIGEWVTSIAEGVTAFYDIDTPITLAKLECGDDEYLSRDLIPRYQLYLSFTGGPTLRRLEQEYGSPLARPLYCSVDPDSYHPENRPHCWDLGYLGTYSQDRQAKLDGLMIEAARRAPELRMMVAGPLYPPEIQWPDNIEREEHLPPKEHRGFYNAQRFTLNLTRVAMIRAGHSPSVRLFEAAACGTAIITDWWDGLDSFFELGTEILVARSADDVLQHLRETSETERVRIGLRARERVLNNHTSAHRALDLERYVASCARRRKEPCAPDPGVHQVSMMHN
jgi:spore maturation protein CgeB